MLEFIHENEYCQGDVTAENIYVNPADLAEVRRREGRIRDRLLPKKVSEGDCFVSYLELPLT